MDYIIVRLDEMSYIIITVSNIAGQSTSQKCNDGAYFSVYYIIIITFKLDGFRQPT